MNFSLYSLTMVVGTFVLGQIVEIDQQVELYWIALGISIGFAPGWVLHSVVIGFLPQRLPRSLARGVSILVSPLLLIIGLFTGSGYGPFFFIALAYGLLARLR